jgi:hypothetical protein
MKKFIVLAIAAASGLAIAPFQTSLAYNGWYQSRAHIGPVFFGERLCKYHQFKCKQVKVGQTWESLFKNPEQRALEKRINRMNVQLRPGMIIAVPRHLVPNEMAYSPFTYAIHPSGHKTVVFDPKVLAWGAYNEGGRLVNWGPASGGQSYCPDIGHGCKTSVGTFTVQSKKDSYCISHKFPVGEGGAPMPYCMYFQGGYALHGSPEVPGYNASHGCVRLFTEDARWLNHSFVETSGEGRGSATRVIILPYGDRGLRASL